MPKVSVIIPTYNRAHYICEAIDSVLNQTYRDFEIIVVDDGSDDNTKEILSKYGDKISYFYQDNRGPSGARNTGIKMAKGEYISFLDSDDFYLSAKIEKQADILRKMPDVDIAYCWWDYLNEKGNILQSGNKRPGIQDINFERLAGADIHALGGVNFPMHAPLIRKRCFESIGFFEESLWSLEDWEFWLRCAYNNLKFYCVQESLVIYRIHSKSLHFKADKLRLDDRVKAIDFVFKKYKIPDAVKSKAFFDLFYEYSWQYFYSGAKDDARDYLIKAFQIMPSVFNDTGTFNRWAYSYLPPEKREEGEVCKNINNIDREMLKILSLFFEINKHEAGIVKYCKKALANAHLALGELHYLARNMSKARRHFIESFIIMPLYVFCVKNTVTFCKSLLSKELVCRLSKIRPEALSR